MKFKTYISRHTKSYFLARGTVTYWHTIRFALIYLMVIQIVTRIFLSAFYTPHASYAGVSILYLENDISNG